MTEGTDAGIRIAQIADELRALAQNGLHFSADDEYDTARFLAVQRLGAELLAMVDTRPLGEIERAFRGELGYRTHVRTRSGDGAGYRRR